MTLIEPVPPMKNGVSASRVFLPAQTNCLTIYDFLCQQFPHISAQEWLLRFHHQLIFDQNLNQLTEDTLYQANCFVFYYRFLAYETPVPFPHHVVFENEHIMVVDKPHFLTISPTGKYVQETLLVRLKHETQNPHLTPIHRIDKDTAGLVMFCKQPAYRAAYQQLFADRAVQKHYHAIAAYAPHLEFPHTIKLHLCKGEPFYTMRIDAEKKPNSETVIECLSHHAQRAKYLLKPITGKQHQLRVHLNHLKIPIENDPLYPIVKHVADDCFDRPLQLLAKQLEFKDPVTGQFLQFESQQDLYL